MDWLILILAGGFEIAFTTSLGKAKTATGTAMILWYGSFLICMTLSLLCLMRAIRTIPLGTAYAVWTGIGGAGVVTVGILVFGEPATPLRLFFLATLIMSLIGLKWVSG